MIENSNNQIIVSTLKMCFLHDLYNYIGSVMVSVLTSSTVDCGYEPRSSQTKDYEIGICCFSARHAALGEKAKTGWLGIRIMCQSGATCLPTDCCFSELALKIYYRADIIIISLNVTCSLHDMAENLLIWC
jgi:hypothetical protein